MKIKDIVTLVTNSTTPHPNVNYNLYSLPSFDNNQMREEIDGCEIQSNKYIVPDKCILFNKLNVRFKRVWRVDNGDENKVCSTEFLPLVVDESKVDYQYCYYILISDYITNYLCGQNTNTSGSHKRIDPTDFLNIELPILPTMEDQKCISQLLYSIDQKIALNRQINDNLEAMAKQLYDYWFVQFNFPNEEGKPYKSSGGKMVWNDKLKREIPAGWTIESIFDALSVQYGYPFSTEYFTEEVTNVPVVRIRDILENTISAYSHEEADNKYLLNEADLLIGMDGNFHMNYWIDNLAYLNQRSVRLRAKQNSNVSVVQARFDIEPYIKAKEKSAKGSTVGHLSDKDLKELKVLVCPDRKLRLAMDALLNKIIATRKENLSLIKQRDELLPLLMNGQVSVNYHLATMSKSASRNNFYLMLILYCKFSDVRIDIFHFSWLTLF